MNNQLQTWIRKWADKTPKQTMLQAGDVLIRYGGAEDWLQPLGEALSSQGLAAGSRVLVRAEVNLVTIRVLLSLMWIGAAPVPVDPLLSSEDLRSRAARLPGPIFLLEPEQGNSAGCLSKTGGLPHRIQKVIGKSDPGRSEGTDPTRLVVFTSGSSGSPKPVRITEENLAASIASTQHRFAFPTATVWCLQLPLFHIAGLMVMFRSLALGGTLVVVHPSQPSLFFGRQPVGVTSLVPAQLNRVLFQPSSATQENLTVFLGGGPVPGELVQTAISQGIHCFVTYGSTETTSMVAVSGEDYPETRTLYPLAGVELSLEGGVISVTGEMVSPGYDGETEYPTRPTWQSSDRGELVGGGIRVLGRADQIIITGGEKVAPFEVEEVLARLPGIEQVVVVGVEDPVWGERVTAVYVGTIPPEEAARQAREKLTGAWFPQRWERLDELPRGGLGKADRGQVQLLLSEHDRNETTVDSLLPSGPDPSGGCPPK